MGAAAARIVANQGSINQLINHQGLTSISFSIDSIGGERRRKKKAMEIEMVVHFSIGWWVIGSREEMSF